MCTCTDARHVHGTLFETEIIAAVRPLSVLASRWPCESEAAQHEATIDVAQLGLEIECGMVGSNGDTHAQPHSRFRCRSPPPCGGLPTLNSGQSAAHCDVADVGEDIGFR